MRHQSGAKVSVGPNAKREDMIMLISSKVKQTTKKTNTHKSNYERHIQNTNAYANMTFIAASSRYNSIIKDNKSSYLTTPACQFGQHRYARLQVGTALTGDIQQKKIDEIF